MKMYDADLEDIELLADIENELKEMGKDGEEDNG